jgi:hypothetical protein
MKFNSRLTAIAIFAIFSSSAFAESPAPLTRDQVRQDLIVLEQTGYRPGSASNINYPDDLQAAEERVASTKVTTATVGIAANTRPEQPEPGDVGSLASKSPESNFSALQTEK